MSDKEKLVELLDDIQARGEDFTDYEIYGMRVPDTVSNEDVASYLIAHGVTVQEWISVKDRLPEDDEVVLIACKIGKMFVGYHKHLYPGCEVWRIMTARDSTKNITYTVTHWMPLPEPAKGE